MRKERDTSLPSRNGRPSARTTSSKPRSYTASYSTHRWSSQQDVLTSPAWRPCWARSTVVLSFRTPHPATLKVTSDGGGSSSAGQRLPPPSRNPGPSQTTAHTLTRAPGSALQSPSARDGEHGVSSPGGNPKGETSSGPRQSALSSLSSAFARYLTRVSTSSSMGTTEASSKGGGKGPVLTSPQTMSSAVFSDFRKLASEQYTQNMSLVRKTLPTPPPGVSTPPVISCSTTLSSQKRSDPFSLTSEPRGWAREAAVRRLAQAHNQPPSPGAAASGTARPKPLNMRPRLLPTPPATSPCKTPATHQRAPALSPSTLRPQCPGKDRLRRWTPAYSHPITPDAHTLDDTERERIKDTMLHAWEEDTRAAYGSGLMMWHRFCDEKQVPEPDRAPAGQDLLSAFVAHMATAYSGKTISGYLSGIRAWHILHSVPWALEKNEMDTMLRAACKLTPSTSKVKPRLPYTPDFIIEVGKQLNPEEPLDAAVFACLTCCFYASARLGEFTVRTINSFHPNTHITTRNLSYDQDRNGLKVTVLHLPSTKAAPSDGEDVFWATQSDGTDPTAALQHHLELNQPAEASHLFTYRVQNAKRPLTKAKFLERVGKAARAAGLEPLQGHGIRIGSTLEYLLRGMPFDVMKAKGRWAGDSFLLYLRKHAIIIAPYIQASSVVHNAFIRYSMPPVR
ncbi:hypothetical protein EDB86DRAFT_2913778 [Lactarius hatsudake]|nr:hypothetical protein EDB86DRAFT_2913778 [Lactarius hatsudake]